MSSGFVSGGTNEQPIERDDAWLRAQQELEEERRRKAEIGQQNGGKSLYEVLEQNKMAKQEAFEEKTKLKNQFRSLDEDEVDFLDSVLESTRAQEAAVKKDTAEQLEVFRKHREEAEKALLGPTSSEVTPAEEEEWVIPARKRRRDKKDLLLHGKKRKASVEGGKDTIGTSQTQPHQPSQEDRKDASSVTAKDPSKQQTSNATGNGHQSPTAGDKGNAAGKGETETKQSGKEVSAPVPAATTSGGLGLVGYGSDSDSE
ncbi:hypothetical protein VI817_006533 [Penicillium citrinum]|uniref:FAM192A/Fyv6 N-terminal domain-containing protein n=1 Tax=Penicillium hetheringtonii TaxID=911720 RepID=A0AAD6GMZ4_9EURO|nr:hypothetical protein N7450_011081 [Penicillium hetheringtonii]KAK5791224.1 hypothetical protein VI817_006533 [Penicillium citrinum]